MQWQIYCDRATKVARDPTRVTSRLRAAQYHTTAMAGVPTGCTHCDSSRALVHEYRRYILQQADENARALARAAAWERAAMLAEDAAARRMRAQTKVASDTQVAAEPRGRCDSELSAHSHISSHTQASGRWIASPLVRPLRTDGMSPALRKLHLTGVSKLHSSAASGLASSEDSGFGDIPVGAHAHAHEPAATAPRVPLAPLTQALTKASDPRAFTAGSDVEDAPVVIRPRAISSALRAVAHTQIDAHTAPASPSNASNKGESLLHVDAAPTPAVSASTNVLLWADENGPCTHTKPPAAWATPDPHAHSRALASCVCGYSCGGVCASARAPPRLPISAVSPAYLTASSDNTLMLQAEILRGDNHLCAQTPAAIRSHRHAQGLIPILGHQKLAALPSDAADGAMAVGRDVHTPPSGPVAAVGRESQAAAREWVLVRLDPSRWVPDSSTLACQNAECGVPFGMLTWRHHCRMCGGVFCDPCSAHTLPLRTDGDKWGGAELWERVCTSCFQRGRALIGAAWTAREVANIPAPTGFGIANIWNALQSLDPHTT